MLDRLRARDCASRARKRKHRTVTLRFYDRAVVISRDVADDRFVASEDIAPSVVAKARGEDGRVDDVCEDDRHGPVNREGGKQIWSLARDRSFKCPEADREFPAEEIDVPSRH